MTPKERLKAAEEFLRELQSTIPEEERVMVGYAEEATVQTDATGKKLNAGWWPVPWKQDKYINESANCYACISSSVKTANPKNGQMRYWRGEASWGHGLALMVDDIGDGKGSKGGLTIDALSSVLPPTAIVQTSPGNHQLWYFLDVPEPSLIRFKSFLIAFVTKVLDKGGDNTIKDIARFGRFPTGINNKRTSSDGPFKYPDENGKPFQVSLVSADYSRRYSIDQIADAFKFTVVIPTPKKFEIDTSEYAIDDYWLQAAVKLLSRAKTGEGSNGDVVLNMSGKYRIQCPWGHEHSNGDTYGAYFRGPIPGAEVEFVFGCGHDTCRKTFRRTWAAFVDEVVMPEVVSKLEAANSDEMWASMWKLKGAKAK